MYQTHDQTAIICEGRKERQAQASLPFDICGTRSGAMRAAYLLIIGAMYRIRFVSASVASFSSGTRPITTFDEAGSSTTSNPRRLRDASACGFLAVSQI